MKLEFKIFQSGFSRFIIVFMVIASGFLLTACDELDALDDLVTTLDKWPEQWQQAMIATIDRLEKMGTTLSKQIAEDLRELMNETIMAVGSEFMCSADFVGERTKQHVQQIRHDRFPLWCKAPDITPWICSSEPVSSIPYKYNANDPNKDPVVKFHGFNFELYDRKGGKFTATIEQDDKVLVSGLGVTVGNDYNLAVSLEKLVWDNTPMDPKMNPRLSLKWTGGDSEIVIETPQPILLYSDCVNMDTGVDTDNMTTCPDGYVLTGIRQGTGHNDGENTSHTIRCCKIISPDRPDISIYLRYDPYRLATGVDTWDFTFAPSHYAIIGLSAGFGHGSWYNTPHDILCRYFTSNSNLFIDYDNSTVLNTQQNIYETTSCPPGNVMTGFAGGTGHSRSDDSSGHLLRCSPLREG
jgi:hypothetical protein